MADHVDKATRSAIMSKVRSKNTGPEIAVRKALHRAGYRFRVHRSDLPGKPDLVFPRYHVALFVHGCFWHRHGCKRATMPASNVEHWVEKFRRTTERDRLAFQKLERSGWTTAIIWECKMEAGISDLISMLTDIAQAGAEKHLKAKEQLRSATDRQYLRRQ